VIENLGFGRQQLDYVTDVNRTADDESADVYLEVRGDESRQHRDAYFTTLDVELPALAHADGCTDELDGDVDVDSLVGCHGVEVDVHRLTPTLVHLHLLDEDGVDLTVDVEVDEAGSTLRSERLVEGARLDAERLVGLAVVHDSRQASGAPKRPDVASRA